MSRPQSKTYLFSYLMKTDREVLCQKQTWMLSSAIPIGRKQSIRSVFVAWAMLFLCFVRYFLLDFDSKVSKFVLDFERTLKRTHSPTSIIITICVHKINTTSSNTVVISKHLSNFSFLIRQSTLLIGVFLWLN